MSFGRYTLTARVTIPAGVFEPGTGGVPSVSGPATTGAAPSAGTTITSQALAAGGFMLSWTGQLSASAAAGDANNFGLYNGAALIATSVNAGAAGTYPFAAVAATVPSGGATVAVKNIGAGTTSTTYTATLSALPLGQPAFGTGGWAGPGSSPVAWSYGFPVTLLPGMPLYLDTAGALYAAIGSGNLLAWRDGTDNVSHAALGN